MSSPPLAPGTSETVFLVLDDFGDIGVAYRETEPHAADVETIIRLMASGQFNNPLSVIAFNVSEGWCRDVSEGIARQLSIQASNEGWHLPRSALGFINRYMEEIADQKMLPFPVRAHVRNK